MLFYWIRNYFTICLICCLLSHRNKRNYFSTWKIIIRKNGIEIDRVIKFNRIFRILIQMILIWLYEIKYRDEYNKTKRKNQRIMKYVSSKYMK